MKSREGEEVKRRRGGRLRLRAHHGDPLQLQIPLVPEILPSLRPLDHIHILDPYAKLAFGIVSRLVGDDHSVLHRHVVVGRSLAYALRAFVYVEEGANAMRGRVAGRAGERTISIFSTVREVVAHR